MRFPKTLTFLILAAALVFALPVRAQQKPFTQEQVVSMVRDGFGDASGATLIEQRGIAVGTGGNGSGTDFRQNGT